MRSLAIVLIALAVPCPAALPPAPQSMTVGYDVSLRGLHIATISESFESSDGEYRLVSDTRPVGLFALIQRNPLRVTSNGRITETGLRPQHFEGKRSDADPRQVRGELDWQTGTLTITHDGKSDTLPLPPGTQDRLSVQYQFMFLAPDKLQQLDSVMTNGRKLDRYRYAVTPGVEIDTPIGRLTTLHLVKERRAGESRTEIWLSPQHRFLPVKIMIEEEDGAHYEQLVTRLEIREAQP